MSSKFRVWRSEKNHGENRSALFRVWIFSRWSRPALHAADARFAEVETLLKKLARRGHSGHGRRRRRARPDCYNGADGFADLENQIPASAQTMWARCLCLEAGRGDCDYAARRDRRGELDGNPSGLTPWYPRKAATSSRVRHILTHTSGFGTTTTRPAKRKAPSIFPPSRPARNGNGVDREPLQFAPGTAYLYSTYAYLLLAGIVEKASGLSYEAWLAEKIFAPPA